MCLAVATSLEAPPPAKHLCYDVERDTVQLLIDGIPVPLDKSQGFAETIVRDTLRGMIHHLKGVDPEGIIRIEVEIEGQP